jgi:hypothetical protein
MPSRREPDRPAAGYAAGLLQSLGAPPLSLAAPAEDHPAVEWALSGAMALTGPADGAPFVLPAYLPACMRGVVLALRSLSGASLGELGDGPALLGERAALIGLQRQGSISPGGACRFVRAADGWIAVNLPRPDDFDLLPALLEVDQADSWEALDHAAAALPAEALVERGRLLGLALAQEGETAPGPWFELQTLGQGAPSRAAPPVVLDFSALWAGPLCAQVLGLLGARVIKVESLSRPDGARAGPQAFYQLMNGGKESLAVDFRDPGGRDLLQRLIARADIVVESSRPRAWTQLGLEPADAIAANPRLTWLSITGHGRGPREAMWPAYGDDAAVAAGASALLPRLDGRPVFAADALADPITGLHAALAAWTGHLAGGGRLVSLALARVTAHALAFRAAEDPAARREAWTAELARRSVTAAIPPPRTPYKPARELGADNTAVLDLLEARC